LRTILTLAAIASLIYAALCLALFLAQRSFIYFPQPKSVADSSPPLILKVDGEEILVSTGSTTGSEAVIYFGGNAEDVRHSLPTLTSAFPDRAIYAMNYRGYGGSTGRPSESALIGDALLLFDRIHAAHPKIVVIGRSLGSGIAVHLASERPVERLVLITPYDSILNIAAAQFPFFPVRWLLTDKFESWRYAPKVSAPTQLIAAQNDEVIPRSSTETLYKDFPQAVASLAVIPGVGHNTISEAPQYISLLRETP
jgi:pimeloyl-ACP methyl ester carboxylesterase